MAFVTGLQAAQKRGFALRQSMDVIRMTGPELLSHLAAVAQRNPLVELRDSSGGAWGGAGGTIDVISDLAVAQVDGLAAHVLAQIGPLLGQGDLHSQLIAAFVDELEPSGWIGGDVAQVAARCNCAQATAEAVLQHLQASVEPAGLFARDLAECLRLQADERGVLTPQMTAVIAGLGRWGGGALSDLARLARCSEAEAQECLIALRRMDPKPGAQFENDATLGREPDVLLRPVEGGWDIALNTARLPSIHVTPVPRTARSAPLKEALSEARDLTSALDMRRSAILMIMGEIVRLQADVFQDGLARLAPMSMAEVADAVGVHASTVSRVLNGLLIEAPCGVIAARELFDTAVGADGQQHARASIMARMRALLSQEDRAKPLSDTRLTELMRAEGVDVSRRTIAKYRSSMGVAPPAERRRTG